jgi:hypothetical protein
VENVFADLPIPFDEVLERVYRRPIFVKLGKEGLFGNGIHSRVEFIGFRDTGRFESYLAALRRAGLPD